MKHDFLAMTYIILAMADLSRKRPQWKKTAVEKVYGDKDYSI